MMGVRSPVEFSDGVTDILSKEWEANFGGKLEFVAESAEEIVRRTLEHIDKKRAALKLPVYDATRFGASGDADGGVSGAAGGQQMAELYG